MTTYYILLGIFSNIFFVLYFKRKGRKPKDNDALLALICIFIFPIAWIKFIKEEVFNIK